MPIAFLLALLGAHPPAQDKLSLLQVQLMDLALSYYHLVVGDIRSGHVCRKLVDIRLYITKVSVLIRFFPVER